MKQNNVFSPRKLSSAIAAMSMILTTPVIAQVTLEEVIVSAQKRTESVQDVPITVAVLAGETLQQFSITNATDLARYVPGLQITPAPQGLGSPRVRGLGTGSGAENIDQSVGVFLDGIWTGKNRDMQSALFDIERVEVIKGSQTSQLGKNTSVGAVLIMSQRPTDENSGYIQVDYDMEFDSSVITAAANISTKAGNYRIAINTVDEVGFVNNTLSGGTGGDRQQDAIRVSGEWDIGNQGSLFATYTYDDREVEGMEFQTFADPQGWYSNLSGDTDTNFDSNRKTRVARTNNGQDLDTQESHRVALEFTYYIGDDTLFTSLSGYNQFENERVYDADFSALDWLEQYTDNEFHQFSQEFRLSGLTMDNKLNYVTGIYYLDNTIKSLEDTSFLSNPDFYPAGGPIFAATGPATGISIFDQDVESWSIFGSGILSLSDKLSLTVGIRYTDETRELEWERYTANDQSFLFIGNPSQGPATQLPIAVAGTFFSGLFPTFSPIQLDREEDNADGSINLQYAFNDKSNAYVSWARGSKSGGFTTEATLPSEAEFDTEVAETIEFGIKAEILDGTLRLNSAIFYTDIEDFQSVRFNVDGFITETIPVESQGIEFESMWAATSNLTLALSATYADTEQTDTEKTPVGSPEWTAAFSLNHFIELGDNYTLQTNTAINYRDDIFTQSGETGAAPALTLVDLRIALAPTDNQWELALMTKNLLDKEEMVFSAPLALYGAVYGVEYGSRNRPRTISLQARYNF